MAYIRPNISIAGSALTKNALPTPTDVIDSGVYSAITTSSDYAILLTDYYIGVNAAEPTTITLPLNPPDCIKLTVKAQMGSPIGFRKITVATQGTNTINGANTYVISIPYESITVISNDGNWWII